MTVHLFGGVHFVYIFFASIVQIVLTSIHHRLNYSHTCIIMCSCVEAWDSGQGVCARAYVYDKWNETKWMLCREVSQLCTNPLPHRAYTHGKLLSIHTTAISFKHIYHFTVSVVVEWDFRFWFMLIAICTDIKNRNRKQQQQQQQRQILFVSIHDLHMHTQFAKQQHRRW